MNLFGLKKIRKITAVFIIALAFNFAVLGLYVFVFLQIRQKNVNIAELSDAISRQIEQQDILRATKEKVAQTSAEREKLDQYFIDKDGVVPFLNSLQSLGVSNGLSVKLSAVTIEPSPVSKDIFEVVKISVEALGSWTDAYRFLSLVELMPLNVSIIRADLNKNTEIKPSVGAKSQTRNFSWRLSLDIGILKLK